MSQIKNSANLEKLFLSICREHPAEKSFTAFQEYPNRQHVINFLCQKLQNYIEHEKSNRAFEWGIIHTEKILGNLRPEVSIESLISIMNMAKHDPMAILFSSTINALQNMGKPALESVYKMYKKDKNHAEYSGVWLSILVKLGVKDKRINSALLNQIVHDPVEAINYMADYKDKSFLPIIKHFVKEAAKILNTKGIDPFEPGIRFSVPEAEAYIDIREVWVELETDLPVLSEELNKRVEELDRTLLKYTGKRNRENRSRSNKSNADIKITIGLNDLCPCGSGKKYKYCCMN